MEVHGHMASKADYAAANAAAEAKIEVLKKELGI